MKIERLSSEELTAELFADFSRYQQVKKCLRKIGGEWVIIDNEFIEDWNSQQLASLADCLKKTVAAGGAVFGAFSQEKLKGFASVENTFFGSKGQYLELSNLHVSSERRGEGIGKKLMAECSEWAREKGAQKLYISAHSSVESQAFYKAIGCVEAQEYSRAHIEKEPCDCQLELPL